MGKYLGSNGLAYLWGKIKATFSTKTELAAKANKATTLSGYGITDAPTRNNAVCGGDFITNPLAANLDTTKKQLFINHINDRLYAANKRFYVTLKVYNQSDGSYVRDLGTSLFSGSHENATLTISEGEYAELYIGSEPEETLGTNSSYLFTYGGEKIFMTFYSGRNPDANGVTEAKIYKKYGTAEWWSCEITQISNNVYKIVTPSNATYLSAIKIKYNGSSSRVVALSDVKAFDGRSTLLTESVVTKYQIKQELWGDVEAPKFIKRGGNASQFLKADGSVDSTTYGTYSKPSGGIPKTDLSSAVQTSLGKADTALQSFTETDPTVPSWAKASTKPTYTASEVGALSDTTSYAHSSSVDGDAYRAVSIPFGQVDSTSTSTAFTAQIPGITELRDGVCVYLRNGVVTGAAGLTVNINNLGGKPVYATMSDATRITTSFAKSYTFLLVYNSTRVEGGCWDFYYGYNTDSKPNGYDIKDYYSSGKKPKTATQRYQIMLSCFDGMLLPVYSGAYTFATTKVLTTEKFNPLGQVYYYNSTTVLAAGANIGNALLCSQATITLVDFRYSFNLGSTLVAGDDVYLVCVPQTDGSAVLHSSPIAFALPATEDGLLYKRLGKCYDTYRIVLEQEKPVYYYKDGAIRLWTNSGIEALEARVETLEEATPIQPSQYYPN